MLSRPGPLPSGSAWSFELKWDGFRAIVSEDGLRVRSRNGWNMTAMLPELRALPTGLVLDGELVAWTGSEPYFPHVCRRVLNRDISIPLTYVVFDVLRRDGVDLTSSPYGERRQELEGLKLDGGAWTTCERFDDGRALFTAVCELGFEGIVAKNHSSLYRPGERGWLKLKNPNYWRRDSEMEAMQRSLEPAGDASRCPFNTPAKDSEQIKSR
jgi:bifunctional non-homologous end joining protein LigD